MHLAKILQMVREVPHLPCAMCVEFWYCVSTPNLGPLSYYHPFPAFAQHGRLLAMNRGDKESTDVKEQGGTYRVNQFSHSIGFSLGLC